jgi:hypothetical protein
MSTGKLAIWSSIAVVVSSLIYFRGDLQRYIKMKMM